MCGILWKEEDLLLMGTQLSIAKENKITIIECPDEIFRDVHTVKKIVLNGMNNLLRRK